MNLTGWRGWGHGYRIITNMRGMENLLRCRDLPSTYKALSSHTYAFTFALSTNTSSKMKPTKSKSKISQGQRVFIASPFFSGRRRGIFGFFFLGGRGFCVEPKNQTRDPSFIFGHTHTETWGRVVSDRRVEPMTRDSLGCTSCIGMVNDHLCWPCSATLHSITVCWKWTKRLIDNKACPIALSGSLLLGMAQLEFGV